MKSIITSVLSAALGLFVLSLPSPAEEAMGKTVTMEGMATCAKCDLGTAKQCTSVLQVKQGDKTVTYMLAGKADMEWHKKYICKHAKKVKVTGTVSEKDGEKILTATSIEMMDPMPK